jgi:periodic tryptophan protein 2
VHVTPANVVDAMSQGEHMQALLLALRLNEKPLLRRVYESVPVERIAVMAANLPRVYVSNMYAACLLLIHRLPCVATHM